MKHGTNCGCPDCEDFHGPISGGGTMSEPTPLKEDVWERAKRELAAGEVHDLSELDDVTPEPITWPEPNEALRRAFGSKRQNPDGGTAEAASELPSPSSGVGLPSENPAAFGSHPSQSKNNSAVKDEIAALRLRVEELTHERDEARKAEAHYLREWLTTSAELGEARQARWIPVEERLPEQFRKPNGLCNYVFVFGGEADPQIGLAYYDRERDEWRSENDLYDWTDEITHWMPLPEPPAVEQREQS